MNGVGHSCNLDSDSDGDFDGYVNEDEDKVSRTMVGICSTNRALHNYLLACLWRETG